MLNKWDETAIKWDESIIARLSTVMNLYILTTESKYNRYTHLKLYLLITLAFTIKVLIYRGLLWLLETLTLR